MGRRINIDSDNATGVKYLHIDNYSKYGNKYIVRLYVKGKVFVVWRGNSIEVGKRVVKEMVRHLRKSDAKFIDWYDNEREEWLEKYGY
jgi:hypothetical protein